MNDPGSTDRRASSSTAVREFLEHDVMAATEGRVQFHTRVAVNVLNIVARELELGDASPPRERERAAALLGHDGDVDDLERELAAAIRSGALDDRLDAGARARARHGAGEAPDRQSGLPPRRLAA